MALLTSFSNLFSAVAKRMVSESSFFVLVVMSDFSSSSKKSARLLVIPVKEPFRTLTGIPNRTLLKAQYLVTALFVSVILLTICSPNLLVTARVFKYSPVTIRLEYLIILLCSTDAFKFLKSASVISFINGILISEQFLISITQSAILPSNLALCSFFCALLFPLMAQRATITAKAVETEPNAIQKLASIALALYHEKGVPYSKAKCSNEQHCIIVD